MSASERNDEIYRILSSLLNDKKVPAQISPPFDIKEVESLFRNSIWGHREIILTIILAKLIDPKFKASENFYACNPRSIYEQPIRNLREHGIPQKIST